MISRSSWRSCSAISFSTLDASRTFALSIERPKLFHFILHVSSRKHQPVTLSYPKLSNRLALLRMRILTFVRFVKYAIIEFCVDENIDAISKRFIGSYENAPFLTNLFKSFHFRGLVSSEHAEPPTRPIFQVMLPRRKRGNWNNQEYTPNFATSHYS